MLIPKIIHFIWLGCPLPEWCSEIIQGWRDKHPGYDIRLWTDDNLPTLVNQDIFDKSPSMSQKSDVIRYELLYQFGGIYADTDTVCLKNLEPLIADWEGFTGSHDEGQIAVAAMGSVPNHPLFKLCIERLPWSFAAVQAKDLVGSTGPGFFTRMFNHWVGRKFTHMECWHNPALCPSFRIFPPEILYPVHYSGRVFGPMENAYTTHLWKFSWKPFSLYGPTM